MDYVAPELNLKGFNCAHCQAYAHQYWVDILESQMSYGKYPKIDGFRLSRCSQCEQPAIWHVNGMVYPLASVAPPPAKDMPDDVAQDYNEARNVLAISPRSSAALLRLVVQKLCRHLGQPGININTDIAALVQRGLSPSIQQALDSVRVIGNNALHPGEMDVHDDQETALKLFKAVNFIIQHTITEQREMEELYGTLPENYRRWIDERDHKA